MREYVYLNGKPLAQIDSGSPESITYLHTDRLGTPRVATNSSGSSVWSWAYANHAFGDNAPTGSQTVNLRMPGQYYDAESGLFYNHNRYYDPATGRYISSDPIGLSGGLNTYAYAMANPAVYVDPEGTCVEDFCIGETIAVSRACWSNPVCRAIVIRLGRELGKRIEQILTPAVPEAAAGGMCPVFDNSGAGIGHNSNVAKAREREKYHKICDTPPPRTGDPCKDAKAMFNGISNVLMQELLLRITGMMARWIVDMQSKFLRKKQLWKTHRGV